MNENISFDASNFPKEIRDKLFERDIKKAREIRKNARPDDCVILITYENGKISECSTSGGFLTVLAALTGALVSRVRTADPKMPDELKCNFLLKASLIFAKEAAQFMPGDKNDT